MDYKGGVAVTDDRLNQIQSVLAELVRIVGNTNAAVEELRADVAELKADVAELKADVAELKADVAELKTNHERLAKNQQILLENQQTLEEKLNQFMQETKDNFEDLNEKMDYALLKLTKHDVKLLSIKKLS